MQERRRDLQIAEPRRCPQCSRYLLAYEDKYLCQVCWLTFDKEETKAYEASILEGFCCFVKEECQAGFYYTCMKCRKSIFVSNEEEEAKNKQLKTWWQEAPERRQEKLKRDAEIADLCRQREEVHQLYKRLNSMTAKELKNMVVTESQ